MAGSFAFFVDVFVVVGADDVFVVVDAGDGVAVKDGIGTHVRQW